MSRHIQLDEYSDSEIMCLSIIDRSVFFFPLKSGQWSPLFVVACFIARSFFPFVFFSDNPVLVAVRRTGNCNPLMPTYDS